MKIRCTKQSSLWAVSLILCSILPFLCTCLCVAISVCADEAKPDVVFRELTLQGDDQVVECKIDIQEVPCLSKTDVKVRLKNGMGASFSSNQITTSCGCVSNLPKEWRVDAGETKEFSCTLTAPRTDETIERHITLSDAELGRSIRLTLKCEAKSVLKLGSSILELPNEEFQVITIPVESRFKGFDVRKLKVQAFCGEAVEVELQASSDTKGEIFLKVTPASKPETVHSSCILEFHDQDQLCSVNSVLLRFPNRTIFNPKELDLRAMPAGGNLSIYSLRLHDELKKGCKLQGQWECDGEATDEAEEFNAKSTDSPISIIQIGKPTTLNKYAKTKIRLVLTCGEWRSEIPVRTDGAR